VPEKGGLSGLYFRPGLPSGRVVDRSVAPLRV
jgi:hypothetical protein